MINVLNSFGLNSVIISSFYALRSNLVQLFCDNYYKKKGKRKKNFRWCIQFSSSLVYWYIVLFYKSNQPYGNGMHGI